MTKSYWFGMYAIDITAKGSRVAWVIQHGLRVVAKGTSSAENSAHDILRALSMHANKVQQESKSDPR